MLVGRRRVHAGLGGDRIGVGVGVGARDPLGDPVDQRRVGLARLVRADLAPAWWAPAFRPCTGSCSEYIACPRVTGRAARRTAMDRLRGGSTQPSRGSCAPAGREEALTQGPAVTTTAFASTSSSESRRVCSSRRAPSASARSTKRGARGRRGRCPPRAGTAQSSRRARRPASALVPPASSSSYSAPAAVERVCRALLRDLDELEQAVQLEQLCPDSARARASRRMPPSPARRTRPRGTRAGRCATGHG